MKQKKFPLLLIVLAIAVVVWLFIPSNSSTSDSVTSVVENVAEQVLSDADNEADLSDFTAEETTEETTAEEPPAEETAAAEDNADTQQAATEENSDTAPTESAAEQKEYVFRNSKLLNQHYEKHGIEMGFASAEEYQAAASAVVNNPDALHKTEKEDGDDVYYVEATNEFVIVSSDGYLRTYFNPSAGLDYYNRQ